MATVRGPSAGSIEQPPPNPPVITHQRRKPDRSGDRFPVAGMLCLIVFVLLSCFYLYAATQGKDTVIGLLLVPVFCLALAPWMSRIARAETGFKLLPIVYLGLLFRFLATYFRLENAADAVYYHRWGILLAPSFRQFDFSVDTQREIPGTGTVRYISGLVSVFTGSSMFAEFLVFTVIAFIGAVFFYLAFITAIPNGDHRRYALLIFLWPTMIYWPSSIGKEAIMLFSVGLTSLGAARLFTRHRGGLLILTAGLWLTLMVRPHIAMLLLVAVGGSFIFTRRSEGSAAVTFGKVLVVGLMLIGGGYMASQTADFLEVDNLGGDGIEAALTQTSATTGQGDAEFSPIKGNNPVTYPAAAATVLLRPFPQEAHNAESFFTSIESLVLVWLVLRSWPRLKRLPHALVTQPFVTFAFAQILLFCYVFSYVANFGILARQRSQVLPMLFVLLAFIPKPKKGEVVEKEPRRAARNHRFRHSLARSGTT
jgi:hypothetical protein